MTATADTQATQTAEKAPLFGKAEKRAVLDPLFDDNPISRQALGVCSALAVTVKVETAVVMSAAVIIVLGSSNAIISALRGMIPNKIRIIVMLTVISSLVTVVDLSLRAFAFDVSKQMTVFVSLIVTNCIVMGRAEAYAMGNPPWRSFLDGVGNAMGYAWILLAVGFFRELLGSGSVLGFQLVPSAAYEAGYVNNGLLLLAPGAFILLGIIIWVQRAISGYKEDY